MDNEQLFDLTSPPSAEFDTAQECFTTAISYKSKLIARKRKTHGDIQ